MGACVVCVIEFLERPRAPRCELTQQARTRADVADMRGVVVFRVADWGVSVCVRHISSVDDSRNCRCNGCKVTRSGIRVFDRTKESILNTHTQTFTDTQHLSRTIMIDDNDTRGRLAKRVAGVIKCEIARLSCLARTVRK